MSAEHNDLRLDRAQERLISTLFEESNCYAALVEVSHEELVALRSGKVDDVESLLGKKDHLLRRISRLEAERLAVAGELATRVGHEPATATLTELKPAFPPAAQELLTELQDLLRDHARELADVNRKNAALLETSLGLVSRWIGFLLRPASAAAAYGGDGSAAAGGEIRTLDSRA